MATQPGKLTPEQLNAKMVEGHNHNGTKEVSRCPQCTATLFEGPITQGEIVNGNFIARTTQYKCVNCQAVWPMERLAGWTVPTR